MNRPTPMAQLVLASGNAHKVQEISAMLEPLGTRVRSMKDFGSAPDVEETGTTFEANARIKAIEIAAWLKEQGTDGATLVLADDSGICIDALDGAPGVYSARFAGVNASDADNNKKMCDELAVRGLDHSAAHYVCVLAITRVDGSSPVPDSVGSAQAFGPDFHELQSCLYLKARCHGVVRVKHQGSGGFGYDPHFWIDDNTRTFAELSHTAKAKQSHRGLAMNVLTGAWDRISGDLPV